MTMKLELSEKAGKLLTASLEETKCISMPICAMTNVSDLIGKAECEFRTAIALVTLAPDEDETVLEVLNTVRQISYPDSEDKKVFYLMAARALIASSKGGRKHGPSLVRRWLDLITAPRPTSIGLGIAACLWAIEQNIIGHKEAEEVIIEASKQPGFRFGSAEEIATPTIAKLLKNQALDIRRLIREIPKTSDDLDQRVGVKTLLNALCFELFKSLSFIEKTALFS